MKGLYTVPTHTIDPGVGYVVFDSFVAFLIIACTCAAIIRRSTLWREAWILYAGLIAMSIRSVLHWIDTIVHRSHCEVNYSYVLTDPFINVFNVASDVLVLWGTWRIMIRYYHIRPTGNKTQDWVYGLIFCDIGAALLWFLSIYQLCLRFALTFSWLSFSDLSVINDIAKARGAFDVTFATFQFLFTFVTWPFALSLPGDYIYKEEKEAALIASLALLARSFCEIVIVGQLNRWPADLKNILRARDVTYGLFSVIFCLFIAVAVPPKDTMKDILILREENAVEDVTTWITNQLETISENGTKTAPSIVRLLDDLQTSLGQPPPGQTAGQDTQEIKKREIRRLRNLYADWEPINKWEREGVCG